MSDYDAIVIGAGHNGLAAATPQLPFAVRTMNRLAGAAQRFGLELGRLNADRIRAQVERETGLSDYGGEVFGGDQLLEGYDRLVRSLNEEACLSFLGRHIAKDGLARCLRNRLQVLDDRKRYPEIVDEKIIRPLVIVGLPRTGSTILHDILARDPRARSPLTWECDFMSPPPERTTYETDSRIAKSEAQLAGVDKLIPGFRAMHPMGARLAQECVVLTSYAFASPIFHNSNDVRSYQDWIDGAVDWAPVYRFHKAQLQHMQWRCKGEWWMLKSGIHMWAFEHLLATYPDIGIIQTHRDPVKVATSFASLATFLRSMSSDVVDARALTADWTPRLAKALEHAMDIRMAKGVDDPRFLDVHFPDLVANPMQVVESIYARFDIELTEEARAAMQSFIDDNPQGKHGIHRYHPSEYGLDVTETRKLFRRYTEHYGIHEEPIGQSMKGKVRDL